MNPFSVKVNVESLNEKDVAALTELIAKNNTKTLCAQ